MNKDLIFIPLLVNMLLTFYVYIRLLILKKRAVQSGDVDEQRRSLFQDAWPDYVLKTSNNIQNQFESPVLFYGLTFILWSANLVSPLTLGLCWFYVFTRIAHAYVHTGSNFIPLRKNIFAVGMLTLLALIILTLIGLLG